jgi:hypothetical protein
LTDDQNLAASKEGQIAGTIGTGTIQINLLVLVIGKLVGHSIVSHQLWFERGME